MKIKLKNRLRKLLVCFILLQFCQLYGQGNLHYDHISSINYNFYDYLVNAGHKKPHFVLNQPYRHFSFDFKKIGINEMLCNYITNKGFYEKKFQGIATELEVGDKIKYLNKNTENRYRASGSVYISYPHIRLYNRTTINEEYKYDPLYAGDLSESEHWLYGRVNDAYMDLDFSSFNIFIGRTKRIWNYEG